MSRFRTLCSAFVDLSPLTYHTSWFRRGPIAPRESAIRSKVRTVGFRSFDAPRIAANRDFAFQTTKLGTFPLRGGYQCDGECVKLVAETIRGGRMKHWLVLVGLLLLG